MPSIIMIDTSKAAERATPVSVSSSTIRLGTIICGTGAPYVSIRNRFVTMIGGGQSAVKKNVFRFTIFER